MKLYYYIILVFIIFINQSHAKVEKSNIIYKLSLKSFGLSINLGEINRRSTGVFDGNKNSTIDDTNRTGGKMNASDILTQLSKQLS